MPIHFRNLYLRMLVDNRNEEIKKQEQAVKASTSKAGPSSKIKAGPR